MKNYYNFTIDYFQDEDGIFTATVPELPGCIASGNTIDDAYYNIKEAIDSCLEVRIKLDMPISENKYEGKNIYKVAVTA